MFKIITPRQRKVRKETTHEFHYVNDINSGFSFPIDKELTEAGRANLEWCLANPDKVIDDGIVTNSWEYTEPVYGRCSCGACFYLTNSYEGATSCPDCGQWYNLFGQELTNPEYWEEDY